MKAFNKILRFFKKSQEEAAGVGKVKMEPEIAKAPQQPKSPLRVDFAATLPW